MQTRSSEEIAQWNQRIETSRPTDEAGKTRFQERLNGVTQKCGVAASLLPHITTWADMIKLHEDRLEQAAEKLGLYTINSPSTCPAR